MFSRTKSDKPFIHSILSKAIILGLATSPLSTFAEEQVDEEKGFEVIVITAQKRAEPSQEAPITLSVFSQDSLEKLGAQSINDIGKATPGLDVNSRAVIKPKIGVRGITNNSSGIGSDSNVVVYNDGVYSGRTGSAVINFNDIERIEILKGPQGTLFGKNAAAGALLIHTKNPHGDFEANYKVTLGNYNKRKVEGLLNIPLTDDIFFRGSVAVNRRDGHIDTIKYTNPLDNMFSTDFEKVKFGNEEDLSVRTSLLWNISDDSELVWRAEFNEIDQDARPAYSVNPDTYRNVGTGDDPFGVYETDGNNILGRNLFGTSVEFNSDLGWANFTSITAFKRYTTYNYNEEDGSANKRVTLNDLTDESLDYYTQEFRFSGQSESGMKWTVGASYSTEELEQLTRRQMTTNSLDSFAYNSVLSANGIPPTGLGPYPGVLDVPPGTGLTGFLMQNPQLRGLFNALSAGSGIPAQQLANMVAVANLDRPWEEQNFNTADYTSFGVFADMTYPLTDKLNLTAGIRWSKDEKDFTILSYAQNYLEMDLPGVPPQFRLIPQALIFTENYVEGADGVKSAVELSDSWSSVTPRVVLDYQLQDDVMVYASYSEGYKSGGFNATSLNSVDQEDISNIELGLKSTLFDKKLRLNMALYDYDYTNFQTRLLVLAEGRQLPELTTFNADATGSGAELETTWLATDNLSLTLNYAYVDAKLSDQNLTDAQIADGIPDLTGLSLPNAPKNKLFAAIDYYIELDAGEVNLSLNYSYTDERTFIDGTFLTPGDPGDIQGLTSENNVEAYGLTNLRVSYATSGESDWKISFYANNLLDVEYHQQAIRGAADRFGSPVIKGLGTPRLFGVEFSQTFY